MKYKINSAKIKNTPLFSDFRDRKKSLPFDWIDYVDGKIVDFDENQEIAMYDGYYICKDWCDKLEKDPEQIIKKITAHCKSKIKLIDSLIEHGYATDANYSESYAYRRILEIIERGDNND